MTRTVLDAASGLTKGSRIDYAILGSNFRGWLPTVSVYVSPHTLGSDHNPVTLTKQVPHFTPPPVIVNDVLRLSDLSPKQIEELHSLLEPLTDTFRLFTSATCGDFTPQGNF